MEILNVFCYSILVNLILICLLCTIADGEIKLRDKLYEKDKKSLVAKKLKKASTESLKQFIKEVDSSGVIRKILKRKLHIPKDSSLTLTSQVSRPNIFPNIFNQGDGFIVDAVVEWPLWLDLHKFAEAMHADPLDPGSEGWHDGHDDGELKSDLDDDNDYNYEGNDQLENKVRSENDEEDDELLFGPPILGGDEVDEARGSSVSIAGIIGLERCHIYEKIETGMSIYLNINRNQSHDCVLRAICEAQLVADYYPYAPSSIFFEVIHLILKPSLGVKDSCFDKYLEAENAAYKAPDHCSQFISKCPLNIAGLFVRNFFPEIF